MFDKFRIFLYVLFFNLLMLKTLHLNCFTILKNYYKLKKYFTLFKSFDNVPLIYSNTFLNLTRICIYIKLYKNVVNTR